MSHVETAVDLYNGAYICSQAVFAGFAEELGLSKEDALKISSGFGGGMRKGEVCGACVGALMAIGLKYGQTNEDDAENRNKTNKLCEEFLDEFASENGSYICNELLGIEFTSEDGMKYAIENNLFSEICLKMVASATKILETKL